MHGLILAGSAGAGGAPSGLTTPALFLELAGRPLLGRAVDTLATLGASTITCVVDEEHAVAAEALIGARARILACSTPSSLPALERGLAALPSGPVFCAPVNAVMRAEDWRRVFAVTAADLAAGADAVLTVTPSGNAERPLYVERGPGGRVERVSDAPIDLACIVGGVLGFGAEARVLAADLVARGRSDVGSLLRLMAALGLEVTSTLVERIVDVDRFSALDAARALVVGESTAGARSEPAR